MKNKKQSPIAVLLELASDSKGRFIKSVLFAIVGVVVGVIPFFVGARVIVALMSGNTDIHYYGILCLVTAAAYLCKVVFANASTTISHSATYQTLKSIRLKMISKLSKMPMGTVVGLITNVLDSPELVRPAVSARMQGTDITLQNVTFHYNEEKEVLRDIDVQIPRGRVVALVGSSGSGKSTIAKLIAGFWDVNDGEITIGGKNIKELSQSNIANTIAYVAQDKYLFDDTVRNNIRMGHAGATDQQVEAVAKAAGCDAFIRNLEKGYETFVDSAGGHLSGGERQRIAIARAMLRNAPIVILDEATAYTDPENEAIIQAAVSKLVQGKTLIVIAHRLSTIIDADKIVVIRDGKVSAQGKHAELLAKSELYSQMWKAHIGAKDGE